jgi:hypothetical protein
VSAAVEGPAVAFVLAVARFLHTINKPVILTEAAYNFIVGSAVEKSASPPHCSQAAIRICPCYRLFFSTTKTFHRELPLAHLFSADKSAFLVDRRIHLNKRPPPGRAHNLPLVTILSPLKLVKTPVSWSSQT